MRLSDQDKVFEEWLNEAGSIHAVELAIVAATKAAGRPPTRSEVMAEIKRQKAESKPR